MSDKASLIVKEQKMVVFYDDEITAVRTEDGTVYIPVRPICNLLGVSFDGQRRRIGRDAVLKEELMSVVVTTTDMVEGSKRPKNSTMLALPLDYISGFLFGINESRVKPELKDRIIRYRRECYKVLADAFRSGALTADNDIESLAKLDPQAAEALVMAQAIVKLARAQLRQAAIVQDNTQRIEALETAVNDSDRRVSDEQASQISQAVKAIAMELSSASGKNEFGGVYGELYRRQGVTSYKMIKTADYDTCMTWLNEWYQSVANKDLNF